MTGTSIALPRVRARLKRRKPPGPAFWRALAWVAWDVFWILWDVGAFINGIAKARPVFAAISIACGFLLALCLRYIDGPRLVREWRRWMDDDA